MKGGVAVMLNPGPDPDGAGRRRHLRVLRPRGGRRGRQRPAGGGRGPSRASPGRRGPAGGADRRRGGGRLPGHHAAQGDAGGGAGSHRPRMDGPATPSTGWRRCWPQCRPTRPGAPWWRVASTARDCRAVAVSGGVAGNVVPDSATLTLNHRFAPDRTPEQAEEHVRSLLESVLDDGDTVELTDMAPAAAPGLDDPLLAGLVRRTGAPVRAKLGWTDAAFFAAARRACVELRPGRSPAGSHGGGARAPRPTHSGARRARGVC